jgi:predicted RND superfamily exporter protein
MDEAKELTEKRISTIQEMYESNQQLIYVSDRKVSALLLINAVLVSFSATWSLKEYATVSKVIILIGVVLAVLSTIMFLLAIIPRVSKKANESLLHYQGILGLTKEKYAAKMLAIDDEDLTKDYLETIYALTSIQKKKNRYLAIGCCFLIISICLLGLSFTIHNF